MLPNEAKLVIDNIRSIVESDGLHVPPLYLKEGMKSLINNLPLNENILRCLETAGRDKTAGSGKIIKNNSLALYIPNKLKTYDAALSFFRLLELELAPPAATFDAEHLKKLHKIIMSDIFKEAGDYRRHNSRMKGNEFLPPFTIAPRTASLLGKLRSEKFDNLSKNEIAMRISYFMYELYIIHPFSEGNGRVSRVFFRQFADSIGYRLNYSKVEGITLRGAEMLAFQTDNIEPLYLLMGKCLSPI